MPKLIGQAKVGEEAILQVEEQSGNGVHDDTGDESVFDQWMNQRGWRNPFMPWRSNARWKPGVTKTISAGRTKVQEMALEEKGEEKEILPDDVDGYSRETDYVPPEFKNERITVLEDYSVVNCGGCRGSGKLACPEEQRCGSCGGKGSTRRHCRNCLGKGTETRTSRTSHKDTGVLWDTEWGSSSTTHEVDCRSCEGSGWISETCGSCRGTGAVRCSKCKGRGYVTCKRCKGGGEVVEAILLQRRFKTSISEWAQEEQVPAKYLKGLQGSPLHEPPF